MSEHWYVVIQPCPDLRWSLLVKPAIGFAIVQMLSVMASMMRLAQYKYSYADDHKINRINIIWTLHDKIETNGYISCLFINVGISCKNAKLRKYRE